VFLSSASFLALHALATPGVLLEGRNAGFVIDVPLGLLLAGGIAATSSLELGERSAALLRRHRLVTALVLLVPTAWGIVSLLPARPLDEPFGAETEDSLLLGLALAGLLVYGAASAGYYLLWRRRRAPLLVAVTAALVLLAEAMCAIAFARNWHATWWEWHLLLLAAFGVVAAAVRVEWRAQGSTAEIFADAYLERTSAGHREVSVLFADLQGFTAFSESAEPRDIFAMLNAYFSVVVPAVATEHGGTVDKLIGDAIMVTFNTRGDQPDHALRSARAALALQREAALVAGAHPGWPRFRVGVNSGRAIVGLLGPRGARSHTVVGDTVNLAARLESRAAVGEVLIGAETRRRLGPAAQVEDLGAIDVKGKSIPVRVFRLVALAADAS
jgi:class 3 adenylate cyclase